jgi:hypothetical protein
MDYVMISAGTAPDPAETESSAPASAVRESAPDSAESESAADSAETESAPTDPAQDPTKEEFWMNLSNNDFEYFRSSLAKAKSLNKLETWSLHFATPPDMSQYHDIVEACEVAVIKNAVDITKKAYWMAMDDESYSYFYSC